MGGTTEAKKSEDVGLKRTLGLTAAINVILGVMIGSGIFISSTTALKYSGSIGLCLVVWIVCGVVSLLGALCFAELGTLIPRSGADYVYLLESMGSLHKFWGPLPAFCCGFVYIVILRPAEVAVIILTFAEYLVQPFHKILSLDQLDASQQQQVIKLIALLALGLITYINVSSVKFYVRINNIFAFCKVFACLVVIGGGLYELGIGNVENLSSGFQGTTKDPGNIALAFYSGLWAYDGWSSVVTITEEIKRPEVNIPRSIMIAVPIITFLYVFMNLAYMTALTPAEIIASPAIGLSFGEKVLGPFAFIVPAGVAISTFGCALSIQFGVTRLCYVAGSESHMPVPLSFVHITRSTPIPSVILQGLVTLVFILVGDVEDLIEFASFLIWFFYGASFVALLIMRKTRPDAPRPYRVPTAIVYLSICVSVFLCVVPVVSEPTPKYFIAIAFILAAVAFYIPFVYKKKRLDLMDGLSYFIQVACQVVPPRGEKEL